MNFVDETFKNFVLKSFDRSGTTNFQLKSGFVASPFRSLTDNYTELILMLLLQLHLWARN